MPPSNDKPRVRLTKAGWYWIVVTMALISIALIKNINLLLIVGCYMFVLLLINFRMSRRWLRHLKVKIDLPDGIHAGTSARAMPKFRNAGRRTLPRFDFELLWANSTAKGRISSIVGGETVFSALRVPVSLRGVYESATVVIRQSYPFGLVETRRTINQRTKTWVFPAIGEIDLERILHGLQTRTPARGRRRLADRHFSEGMDIHGLRPFRAGDSPRWIHWRTTARVGVPIVRELDCPAGTSLIVAVNLASAAPETIESTLVFLASLVVRWPQVQDGHLLLLVMANGSWARLDLEHRRGVSHVLRALAEWPDIGQAESYSPLDGTSQPAMRSRSFITVGSVKQRAALPPGLSNPVFTIDPTKPSNYYKPPQT